MERSRKVLLKIASFSSKVIAAANDYADRKDALNVQLSHFQLEEEMRKIAVACQCLADTVCKTSLQDGIVDERLKDWLRSDEPQMCFDTLDQMEKLLQQDTFSRSSAMSLASRSKATTKDKIDEVVGLLESRRGFFHFLFSAEIWNNERTEQPQHVGRITPGGSADSERTLIFGQTNMNATTQDIVIHQDRHSKMSTHTGTIDAQQSRKLDEGKLDEISKWLDGLNCAMKQDLTLSLRQPDTCKWLFDTTEYRKWRCGESSFLWLQGKPGAGKSVLVSSVIESLEESCEGEPLAFFYCDFRNERSTSASEVMRSILSQILRHFRGRVVDPGSLIDDLVKGKERGGATRNATEELTAFASRAAALLDQRPLVVVDALDECKDVETLARALVTLQGHARLFVASRPLQVIKDGLSGLSFISIDDMVEELSADIELHVTRELDARRRLRQLDAKFKSDILSVLCSKADGMFRWVQCSIETLNRCVTRREVQVALDSLPDGLDETYERILLGIDAKACEGSLVRRSLMWLLAALRPLRLGELLEGLSIDLEMWTLDSNFGPMHSAVLLDACGSLVTYNAETDIIILSHFSVKEYLMGSLILAKLPQFYVNLERAHLHLARLCMCYISIYLSTTSSNRKNCSFPTSYPLCDYVLGEGFLHFQHLGGQFKSILRDAQRLEKDIQQRAGRWDNVCLSAKNDWYSIAPGWPTSVHDLHLYLLVAFAPHSLLHDFLRRTPLKCKEGVNPLVYTAYFNKEEHARVFLSHGVELNHRGWDTHDYHQVLPIEVAMDYHHHNMVTLFATQGSIIPPQVLIRTFSTSFWGTHISYSMAKILLQTDDFAEAAAGQPTLLAADILNSFRWIENVDEQDIVAIIRRYSQVMGGRRKSNGETSLRSAIEGGFCLVARYLLALGVPLPCDIFTDLSCPGKWTKGPMIRFLVENGANALTPMSNGDSVLHVVLGALNAGDNSDTLQSAQLLVAHGCNPLAPNVQGQTPIQVAVERGFVSVAHYLLHTLRGRIPLFPDPLRSCGTLSENNNVSSTTGYPASHRCDPFGRNDGSRTLLHIAVEHGLVSTVRHLISETQDEAPLPSDLILSITRPLPRRPVRKQHDMRLLMLRLLVEKGANVLVSATIGGSALHDVLKSFDDEGQALEATKLLVARGCDPHGVDICQQTPMCFAIRRMFIQVVQYLLSLGVHLPRDPLLVALDDMANLWKRRQIGNTTKLMMVRLLLENGADACASSMYGDSTLHVALRSFTEDGCALETARLLVSHGCDPLVADWTGRSALCIAIQRGHVSVARYLLSLRAPLDPSPDPLQTLSSCKKASMVWFLVENMVDASTRTVNGDTMLHVVLKWRRMEEDYALEAVKVLVARGCDPFEANSFGQTPLHITFERGYVSVSNYLLSIGAPLSLDMLLIAMKSCPTEGAIASIFRCMVERGIDVHARTINGETLLHIVLQSLWEEAFILELAELLICYGCDPLGVNSSGETPLHVAVKRGHVSVTRYLVQFSIPLAPDLLLIPLGSVLPMVLPSKRISLVRCLVENGADVQVCTSSGESALHVTLQSTTSFLDHDVLEIVKLLVQHGCDPIGANSTALAPFHIALERGLVSVARYLLSFGVSPAPDLLLIVLGSARLWGERRVALVRCLVDNGADVHVRTSSGDSILHLVLQSLDEDYALETVKFLVGHGCDTSIANSSGQTPLHVAVERGHFSVARYLLRDRGVVLPPDMFFVALRSQLTAYQKTSLVRFLVWNGASVDVCTTAGDSVLHVALQSLDGDEVLEVAELLVGRGCDVQRANLNGQTPLHVAVERGHVSVVRYILQVRGVPPSPELLSTALNSNLLTYNAKVSIVSCLVENSRGIRVQNAARAGEFRGPASDMADSERLQDGFEDARSSHICDPGHRSNRGGEALPQNRSLFKTVLVSTHSSEPPAAKRTRYS